MAMGWNSTPVSKAIYIYMYMYGHSPQNPPKHIFPWDLHHKMLQKCVWFLGNLQRKTSANAIFDFLKCVCLLGYLQCTASANAMCWYSLGRAPWRKLKNPNKLEKNWKRKCFLRLLARPPPICFFDVFFRFSQGCFFLHWDSPQRVSKYCFFYFFDAFWFFLVFALFHLLQIDPSVRCFIISTL